MYHNPIYVAHAVSFSFSTDQSGKAAAFGVF